MGKTTPQREAFCNRPCVFCIHKKVPWGLTKSLVSPAGPSQKAPNHKGGGNVSEFFAIDINVPRASEGREKVTISASWRQAFLPCLPLAKKSGQAG